MKLLRIILLLLACPVAYSQTVTTAGVTFNGTNGSPTVTIAQSSLVVSGTGGLVVTNAANGTNIAQISAAGTRINGVGFTNSTIDIMRTTVPAGDTSNGTTTYSDSVALDAVLPVASRSYAIRWVLFVDNTTAADGIKLDMQNGTASVSSVRASLVAHDNSGLLINARVSALATSTTAATLTGNGVVVVDAGVTITTAGTVKLRVAKNSNTTGTVSIRALSYAVVNAQ
jgi:hypothetical protein